MIRCVFQINYLGLPRCPTASECTQLWCLLGSLATGDQISQGEVSGVPVEKGVLQVQAKDALQKKKKVSLTSLACWAVMLSAY